MTTDTEWKLLFYQTASGASPVREFLRSLDKTTRVRFGWSLEQLRLRNTQAQPPLVKHIEGKLWELREESSTNIYRIFYCLYEGQRILVLHGFAKKTQKTPRREIEIALQRLADFRQRKGGELYD